MPEPREHELSEDCWCEPQVMRLEDGEWVPAEPIPFHYGLLPRIARWFTRGRWPR